MISTDVMNRVTSDLNALKTADLSSPQGEASFLQVLMDMVASLTQDIQSHNAQNDTPSSTPAPATLSSNSSVSSTTSATSSPTNATDNATNASVPASGIIQNGSYTAQYLTPLYGSQFAPPTDGETIKEQDPIYTSDPRDWVAGSFAVEDTPGHYTSFEVDSKGHLVNLATGYLASPAEQQEIVNTFDNSAYHFGYDSQGLLLAYAK